MSTIKIEARNNIKVYNYCASRVCAKGTTREFDFLGAKDGVGYMLTMSFDDIVSANSKNPDLFPTGMLVFEESERDEILNLLGHGDWKDRFWTEESIENALLFPTKAKMERILAVRDILTIERIRGKMTYLINVGARRPIEDVINLVNERWSELLRGIKRSRKQVVLPAEVEDTEKKKLKNENKELQDQLKVMQEQIAALMAAQAASPAPAKESPAKKTTTRKKTE